jgi:hypothetical protein
MAAEVPVGCDGLLFHPYLQGERAPYWDPLLRADFVGMTMGHGRGHFVRALYEGIAFSLRDVLGEFRAQGLDTATLDEVYKQLKSADGVVKVDPQLRNKIGEQLQEAKFSTRDPSMFFQAQDLMSTYHQSFDLASRVSKAEHEAYMTAIKHLVA